MNYLLAVKLVRIADCKADIGTVLGYFVLPLTTSPYRTFTTPVNRVSHSPPLVVVSLVQADANGCDECQVNIRRNCNKILPGDFVSKALREDHFHNKKRTKDNQSTEHSPSAYSQRSPSH